MRPAHSLTHLAVCLSTWSSVASAASWPRWLPHLDALVVRQDSPNSGSASAIPGSSPSATGAAKTDSAAPASNTAGTAQAGANTAKAPTGTGSAGATATGTGTASGGSGRTEFPPDAPPGGISMQTPNTAISPSGLYRVSDFVTWSWNYTSLQATPTAVDVLVSCSSASATWVLTSNMTFATSVNYVWDTKLQANDANNPPLVAMYTLIVKDSAVDISRRPEAGYLNVATAYQFGLYTSLPYVPFNEWQCPGCSSASSIFNSQVVGLAVMMSFVTVASFTWFVSGLGLY